MAAQLCLTLCCVYNVCISSMCVCMYNVCVSSMYVCMYNVCISVWLLSCV